MLVTFCRYAAAFAVITYGFAKLNGAQFTVLESELDRPMRDVSGFWLTWYYFGYSKVYGSILALVQIAGGVGLMFRRTTLLAACLLFGMMANIILIDVFYGIDLGATIVALLIVAMLLAIIAEHQERLLALFWAPAEPGRTAAWKWLVRAACIVLPVLITYWAANYNNRYPTRIDGVWRVASASNPAAPTRVYFEPDRAFMAVFRRGNVTTEHHFELTGPRTVRIWRRWLQKGPVLFDGSFDEATNRIELSGRLESGQPVRMTLVRERPPAR